ncbi:MAG: CBS domain-containing protein [Thermoplasmata archaeon]|uniref:CBS domain-containing protein n=1 Tax=Candidatus Sysuiplasma superficiale TaxID=2823368 RepID=A0A8J8CC59_9ARCH|nr:CBS domain-containing protein [Candidatus Sysuiplasma superficiale]MBX8644599.1 CBS domain-containing protein [Candidatus Sysuiplasma superficiale]MCL4347169.1 CBS domain-containing protein [Candidatus Thermoplasmatota archaeon]
MMNKNLFASMSDVSVIAGKLGKISIGRPEVRWPVLFASPQDEVRTVASRMIEFDLDEIPVIDRKRVVGVVSLKSIVRGSIHPGSKVKNITVKAPELHPWSNVFDLAEAIVNTGYRQLPVVEDGKLVGIADRTLLVRLIGSIREINAIPVSDVMTPSVTTLKEGDYLDRAFEIMRSTGIRAIPVVNDGGRMVALLRISDLVSIVVRGNSSETMGELVGRANPVEIRVGSIAHRNFQSVKSGETMGKVLSLMSSDEVTSLPVLENGVPAGIITKFDVAQLVLSLLVRESVYVQINGISDAELLDVMHTEVEKSVKRIENISRPISFYIHVHSYNSEFGRIKYSLSGKLQTVDRLFVAKSFDWDLIKTTQDLLSKLERMVKEMKAMKVSSRRRKRSERHMPSDQY